MAVFNNSNSKLSLTHFTLSCNQPGVRTYLELRSFIEDSIKSLEAGDGEDVTHQRIIAEQIARLPQVMTY